MADALKKLFARMAHISDELKSLQQTLDKRDERPDAAAQQTRQKNKTSTATKRLVKSDEDHSYSGGQKARSAAWATESLDANDVGTATLKRALYREEALGENPGFSESPPPKPAPRDAKLLPLPESRAGERLPYSHKPFDTLPRNVTPDPLRVLPGAMPSWHNYDVSDMTKVYPNAFFHKKDNQQRTFPVSNSSCQSPELPEQQNVPEASSSIAEAQNLLRLGWVALEFLRDDQRPCCIVEVCKSNVTQLGKTRRPDAGTITTMVDATDPLAISLLMQSTEKQPPEGPNATASSSLPSIMFENPAFLNIRKRLQVELGPAIAKALRDERPRIITTGSKDIPSSNPRDSPQKQWMRQDSDSPLERRKVHRDFVDSEGKMWRITSIDVTPDVGQDPLSLPGSVIGLWRGSQDLEEQRDEDSKAKRGSGRREVISSTTKGWKVFHVEAVFSAPVGVDWPTSSSPSNVSTIVARSTSFPITERPEDTSITRSLSRKSTVHEVPTDIGSIQVTTNPTTAGIRFEVLSNHPTDIRRMSIQEETIPSEQTISCNSQLEASPAHVTQSNSNNAIHEFGAQGLGARVKVIRSLGRGHIEFSAFVGLEGKDSQIQSFDSINVRQATDSELSQPQKLLTSLSWPTLSPKHKPEEGRHSPEYRPHRRSLESGAPELFDWTRGQMRSTEPELGQHYSLLRDIPWENTGFGPLFSWSGPLRLYANTIMTFPHPTTIYWGPEFLQLYNVGWKTIVQQRHPSQLGMPFERGWPELTTFILPLIKQCFEEGITTKKVNEPLFIDRQVAKEECYFHFHIGPLIGDKGIPEGVIEQAFDRTNATISERRDETTKAVIEASEAVRNLNQEQFWQRIIHVLAENPRDFPFALIYIHQEEEECYLAGSLGVPDKLVGQAIAPLKVTLAINVSSDDETGYVRYPAESGGFPEVNVLKTLSKLIQCEVSTGGLPSETFLFAKEMTRAAKTGSVIYKELSDDEKTQLDRIEYRGFRELCNGVIIAPIQPTTTRTHGYLIAGVNPRRPYDQAYRSFYQTLIDHLSTTVARVKLITEDFKDAVDAELAFVERRKAAELHDKWMEAIEQLRNSEVMFTKFAESIPIGMAIVNPQGHFVFVNDAWYDITTCPKGTKLEDWIGLVYEEDRNAVRKAVQDAFASQKRCSCGFRIGKNEDPNFKRAWKRWVIKTFDPDIRDGKLKGIFSTIVDVTSIKMAELYQQELTNQAIENERRQENFIDITSHELRNPLSAILQSAESILREIELFNDSKSLDSQSIIESSRTILLCVHHQTRIIEDILTVSKLDAMLLTVSPVEVQVHDLLRKSLAMFDDEVKSKDIVLRFEIKESYRENKTNWVLVDPARVTQVLVNLITNAIKFTALVSGEKKIWVYLESSRVKPVSSRQMPYLPCTEEPAVEKDITTGPE